MKITIEVETTEQLREILEKLNSPKPLTFPQAPTPGRNLPWIIPQQFPTYQPPTGQVWCGTPNTHM